METQKGIMECTESELPEILQKFLNMIADYLQQAEGKEELKFELRKAYDRIAFIKKAIDHGFEYASSHQMRNDARMTMKHIYKLVAVELCIENNEQTK